MDKAMDVLISKLASMTTSSKLDALVSGFEQISPQEREQKSADLYNQSQGNLNEQDGYECSICKNKGFIAEVKYNEQFGYYYQVMTNCKCRKVRNAINRLNRSGLKDAVKRYTFDNFQTPELWQAHIKEAAMRFCTDDQHTWFYIAGNSGSGKSHICTAIAVHYIRKGMDTHYMLWRDEIMKLKASVTDPEAYSEQIKELKEVPVLYIDDFFKNGKGADGKSIRPTAADVNAAFEIINYRYNTPKLITIISSERTLDELMDIDEATTGRIIERSKEGGYCLNMKRDGSRNWRLRGLEEV